MTVLLFIRPPLGTALRDQYVTNNHHYFSFLEQLWTRVVGSSSELSLRILPIFFAATAVALVTATGLRRFGWLPGTVAGVTLASSPMFLVLAREVRGYSLLVLCAVVSTMLVLPNGRSRALRRYAYIAAVGVGIGTHLFMMWVVVGHVVYLATRRRADGEWVFRWAAGMLAGAIPYVLTLHLILRQERHRFFERGYPVEVLRDVLGVEPLTVATLAALCAVAAWPRRKDPLTWRLAAVGVVAVLVTWLAPNQPGTRFFVWAIPGVALGAAAAVRARPLLVLALLPAVAAGVLSVRHGYTSDSLANRRVAPLSDAAVESGRRVCGLGGSTEALHVYLKHPIPTYFDSASLRRCDVVVVINPALEPALVRATRRAFPHERVVPASRPALVLSKEPLPE